MTIDSSGRVLIGNNSSLTVAHGSTNADNLVIGAADDSGQSGITLGSTTASSIRFADASDDTAGAVVYNHSTERLTFYANSGLRATIDSDGLKFFNDTSSNNALDDYEEGSYNPTASLGSGSITSTTSFTLRYVKIGRLVHLVGRLHFATSQNDLSAFSLSLPFANSTGNKHDTSVCTHIIRGNGGDPVQGIRIFRIGPGATTMYMNNHEGQSIGDLGTTSPHININFSYFAA